MSQRHGERVGGVEGHLVRLDVEHLGDEQGNLLFGGVAEATNGLLDFARGIFVDGNLLLRKRGDDDATGRAEDDGRADVAAEEAAFHGGDVGLVELDEFADAARKTSQAFRNRRFGIRLDDAAINGGLLVVGASVDDAPSCAAERHVQTDDAQLLYIDFFRSGHDGFSLRGQRSFAGQYFFEFG